MMSSFKKLQKALEQDAKADEKEITGLNLEDCLVQAEEVFGVDREKISYEILEEGEKKGFIGMKKLFVRIVAHPKKGQVTEDARETEQSFSDEFSNVVTVDGTKQTRKQIEEEKFQEPIQFVSKRSGVYLKVLKGASEEEASVERAMYLLTEKNYQNFNHSLLKSIVNEKQGEWVRIGDYTGNPEWESTMKVQVTSDKMRAFLRIDAPQYWGRIPEVEEVEKTLAAHGVLWGVKDGEIQKILEEQSFNIMHLIAEGKKVHHGESAKIKYHFNTKGSLFSLEEDESGKVDFFGEFLRIQNVDENQVLAEKIPPTKGEEGYNVKGESIPPNQGKDLVLKIGRNTSLSEDGLKVIANITGRALYKKGAVNVEPSFQVSGNVNSHTGSIQFAGDVMIRGSVEDSFSVDAGGNLFIGGSIGKANIKSGGTLMVQRGILGSEDAKVEAQGDVVAHFVENATIVAGERLIIREAILHSRVRAKNIYCLGKRGTITGGVIQAVENVYAKVLGSSSYTETRVEVGQDPQTREKLLDMEVQKRDLEEKLEQVKQYIEKFQTGWSFKRQNLTGKNKQQLDKALELKEELEMKLPSIVKEYHELREYSDNLKIVGGLISVSDRIYPKTEIGIRGKILRIRKDQSHVSFGFRDGDIGDAPYVKPRDEEVLKLLEQGPGAKKKKS